jgi:hypothetical protein
MRRSSLLRTLSSLEKLDDVHAEWRDRIAHRRRHATRLFMVIEPLEVERQTLRALPPSAFDAAGRRLSRVPTDRYLKYAGSFYGVPTGLIHQRVELRWDRELAHRFARTESLQSLLLVEAYSLCDQYRGTRSERARCLPREVGPPGDTRQHPARVGAGEN